MFAVIKTGGKQYKVAAEDVLKIEKLPGEAGDFLDLDQVLMVGEGADITVGSPVVEGALVSAEIIEQGRDRKVIAFKKRRRQNSRRTIGHRQHQTKIRIAEILTGGKKAAKKSTVSKDTAAKADTAKAAPKAEAKKAAPKKETKAEAKSADEASTAAPLFKAPKGDGDKLTDIKGIGPVAETQLKEQGITTFAQIAKLTDAEVATIDENMPFSADQISDWRDQAKELTK